MARVIWERQTRREFLERSGAAAAALGLAGNFGWLAGCGSDSFSQPAWNELAAQLDGKLLRAGDASYAATSRPYNLRYASTHPQGVAVCAGAEDVRLALRWAVENEIPVAIRSGGHNYAGYSTGPGLVINLGQMREVEVDDVEGTVTAQPGARNTIIYAGLQPHGVAISAGRCPTVAVGGLVLGGGVGFSSRKLGLTCDHLIEAEVVTAGGELVRASESENADLFWALRGGGGGNFGVSTSFTFTTNPVSDVGLYDLAWDWRDAEAVFAAFQELFTSAPNEFSARLGVGRPGGEGTKPGELSLNALGQYFGPVEELRELLAPALAAGRVRKQLIARRTFWQAKEHFFHNTPAEAFAVNSAYLDEPLAGSGLEALLQAVESWPGSSNPDGAGAAIFASGGAINEVPADATAFVHRDKFALLATEATWTLADSRQTIDANVGWLSELRESLAPSVSASAYQNFITRDQPGWQRAYYGSNFERLVEVKNRYDPDDVFSFEQSIPLD